MSVFKKLSRYSLDPANILAYGTLTVRRVCATAWSCLKLHTKAALLGVEVDAHVSACGTVLLHRWPDSRICIGPNCTLLSSPWRGTAAAIAAPVRLATYGPTARLLLGRGVELSGTSITVRSTSISIGDYSMIAPNCVLVDSDFHAPWPAARRHLDPGMERDKPVTLGKHVWLGMHCVVLKGVTIGDGAIIGAGSVVTRDIPPYCVAAGSPARVVKQLPPPTSTAPTSTQVNTAPTGAQAAALAAQPKPAPAPAAQPAPAATAKPAPRATPAAPAQPPHAAKPAATQGTPVTKPVPRPQRP